jgi:site-specific recombinase XerD
VKLHSNAQEIITKQNEISKDINVFKMPSRATMRYVLKAWLISAALNKRITFHSARHTFATMLLTFGVDIYTVSKLLGHKDIKTTQVYAKLIDLKKDEAIDKLPYL